MKTVKMIIITALVALGMMLLSVEATTPWGVIFHFTIFVAYACIFALLCTHTSVFRVQKFTSYDIDKDLAEFLYKRRALDAFVSNLNNQSTYKTVYPDLDGFDWEDTPEGSDYWKTLWELWQIGGK